MPFRWDDWNLNHATKHGVSPEEAEGVVDDARPPYPQARGDNKWCVWGRGIGGRFIQVVYIVDSDGTLFIIHARLLTDNEKRNFRRPRR